MFASRVRQHIPKTHISIWSPLLISGIICVPWVFDWALNIERKSQIKRGTEELILPFYKFQCICSDRIFEKYFIKNLFSLLLDFFSSGVAEPPASSKFYKSVNSIFVAILQKALEGIWSPLQEWGCNFGIHSTTTRNGGLECVVIFLTKSGVRLVWTSEMVFKWWLDWSGVSQTPLLSYQFLLFISFLI